ncbi:MAG: hypothetical protein V9E98_10060 [Candidatus Nanopelagicales bacterium]
MDQFTRTIVRGAALPTAGAGLVITAGVWIFGGSAAGLGALLGTAVVVVFFMIGQLVLGAVLRNNPQMGLMVAMTLYIIKIGVLLGLLLVLQGTTAFDTKAFALTILACTLVWTACEVVIFSRTKVLYVDPENVPRAVKESSKYSAER